jgi:hypothetical protein
METAPIAQGPVDGGVSLPLPCPFCGKPVDLEDHDTLYPSGTGWRDDENGRTYQRYNQVPKEQWCWKLVCNELSGGCGAEIHGDSRQEALAKWNTRTNAPHKPRSEAESA